MTSFSATPPVSGALPVPVPDRPDQAPGAAPTRRHDPGQPPAPPAIPAPLKGLGIPPLHTRAVGDFDRIDDPPPPMGIDLSTRLAELDPPAAPAVDLRR